MCLEKSWGTSAGSTGVKPHRRVQFFVTTWTVAYTLPIKNQWLGYLWKWRLLSCIRLCNSTDCSPTGSSVHGIIQARISGVSCHSFDLPDPGIKPRSLALQADSLLSEHQGSPIDIYLHTYIQLYADIHSYIYMFVCVSIYICIIIALYPVSSVSNLSTTELSGSIPSLKFPNGSSCQQTP